MDLREALAAMLSGWGTNNAAGAASSPYKDVGLQPMSMGPGQAPTIYDNGGLPADVVQRGAETMRGQMYPRQHASGQITPYPEPPVEVSPASVAMLQPQHAAMRRRRVVPTYDHDAMDYLTAQLQEGPNSRIDDDTRARALEWALRQNQ